LESDLEGYSAYNAGLVNMRVSAPHVPRHHVLCGVLRRDPLPDLVVTNVRFSGSATFIRAWTYLFADERINYLSGQMEVFGLVPPHWPFGLFLEPVPLQVDI
jgi:hypothetical protein